MLTAVCNSDTTRQGTGSLEVRCEWLRLVGWQCLTYPLWPIHCPSAGTLQENTTLEMAAPCDPPQSATWGCAFLCPLIAWCQMSFHYPLCDWEEWLPLDPIDCCSWWWPSSRNVAPLPVLHDCTRSVGFRRNFEIITKRILTAADGVCCAVLLRIAMLLVIWMCR
jgi:hypothetical protein